MVDHFHTSTFRCALVGVTFVVAAADWFKRSGPCIYTPCSNPSSLCHHPQFWHNSRRHHKHSLCYCSRRRNCRLPCTLTDRRCSCLGCLGRCTCTPCSNPSSLCHRPQFWHNSRRHHTHILCCCYRRRNCRLPCTEATRKKKQVVCLGSLGRGTCTPCSNPSSLCHHPQFWHNSRRHHNRILCCCYCHRNCPH